MAGREQDVRGTAASPLSARRAFWLAQIGGWSAYGLVLYLTYLPTLRPEQRWTLLAYKGLRAPLGMVASLALHALYRRLRAAGAGLPTLAPIALVSSLVLGAGLFAAHRAIVIAIGLSRPPFFDWPIVPRAVLDFAFALMAWSAAYFGITFWQDAERRQREAEAARLLAREAQLEALAYQLNPHFLFNALNSLRALVDEDPQRARRMVTELAGFLRYALVERPLQLTTLDDEIAALRDYLAIERIRFEERLVTELSVEPAAGACQVPAFLVHPLVENALKHGGGRDGEPLRVSLRAWTDDARLHIDVWNSGRLRAETDGAHGRFTARDARCGVGLRNVRARLERLYPDAHRFTLERAAGGVRARVELPRVEAPAPPVVLAARVAP